jgi:hypothetical protein
MARTREELSGANWQQNVTMTRKNQYGTLAGSIELVGKSTVDNNLQRMRIMLQGGKTSLEKDSLRVAYRDLSTDEYGWRNRHRPDGESDENDKSTRLTAAYKTKSKYQQHMNVDTYRFVWIF